MVDSKEIGNYIVYSDGKIWSKRKNKYLKPNVNPKNGYSYIHLYINGKSKATSVHRLIATLFIPNTENKKTVNHIDGDKQNNSVDNLQWNTHSENHKHAYRVLNRKPNFNLGNQKGNSNNNSKLTEKDVYFIKTSNLKGKELAKKYNVSSALISLIKNNKLWTHL